MVKRNTQEARPPWPSAIPYLLAKYLAGTSRFTEMEGGMLDFPLVMNTCTMCHSLYLKANGELPCWDDVGELELIFRTLDETRLLQGRERNIFYSPELLHIRRSFLNGQDPYPEVCRRCAVRGHGGGHSNDHPDVMEILHLESSYLCHLSCPQCIPAARRHALKAPPYHLSVGLLQGLLAQLRSEGVRHIKVVHFEGRGDPLMNPHMNELIAAVKRYYPRAMTMVTTHASYPYKPWVVESGLDLLRTSIDGAFPENYARYRIGGSLETALTFLRSIRDHRRVRKSGLRVDWKYILFEWNDSDAEIAHAAELAEELEVRLLFTLTHTPGKSARFPNADQLQETLKTIAPKAAIDMTFERKDDMGRKNDKIDTIISEHSRLRRLFK